MSMERALMADAFTQIETRIFFGDRLRDREFLSLANPGQFIAPDLDESNLADQFIQSELVDPVLDASWLYKTKTGKLSGMYGEMLEFAKLPQLTLTPAQQQEIRDLEVWLRDNGMNYDRFERRYDEANDEYLFEVAENPTSPRIARLLERKNRSMRQWETLGRKVEHERKESRINYLNSGDPNLYWQSAKDLYNNSKVVIAEPLREFYPTLFYPPVLDWSVGGWSSISMETYERHSSYYSRSTSWGGGASLNFGLWSIGGGASGHSEERHYHSETSRVRISFDFMRVALIRPWLRESLFSLRSWGWKRTHDPSLFSDGGEPPAGRMPLLVKSVLLAKNVEISASWSQYDLRYKENSFSGGASVGWGPFRVRGSYSTRTVSRDVDYEWEDDTLKVTHPQIIGYLGTLLPRSPHPDPSLSWEEGGLRFAPDELDPDYVRELSERRHRAGLEWELRRIEEQKETQLEAARKEIERESRKAIAKVATSFDKAEKIDATRQVQRLQ